MGAPTSRQVATAQSRVSVVDVPHDARGNGLSAPAWAPLLDLPPSAADALLDALRRAGLAAFVAPAVRRTGRFCRAPDRCVLRLWVEVRGRAMAEDVVRVTMGRLQGPG